MQVIFVKTLTVTLSDFFMLGVYVRLPARLSCCLSRLNVFFVFESTHGVPRNAGFILDVIFCLPSPPPPPPPAPVCPSPCPHSPRVICCWVCHSKNLAASKSVSMLISSPGKQKSVTSIIMLICYRGRLLYFFVFFFRCFLFHGIPLCGLLKRRGESIRVPFREVPSTHVVGLQQDGEASNRKHNKTNGTPLRPAPCTLIAPPRRRDGKRGEGTASETDLERNPSENYVI